MLKKHINILKYWNLKYFVAQSMEALTTLKHLLLF